MTAITQTASDPLYISQLAYGHVSYRTDIRHPENVRYARNGDIRCAGCGLCAAYMMVRSMTNRDLRIELFRDLSYRAGANLDPGTDMLIYGRALAETFRLSMAVSDDERKLIAALKSGAKASSMSEAITTAISASFQMKVTLFLPTAMMREEMRSRSLIRHSGRISTRAGGEAARFASRGCGALRLPGRSERTRLTARRLIISFIRQIDLKSLD